MTDTDGLPAGTLPARTRHRPPPGLNDLDTGMVGDSWRQITSDTVAGAGRWGDKVNDALSAGAPMRVPGFNAGPSLFRPKDTELVERMGVDPDHTGALDIVSSVGKGMAYMFGHMYTALTDPAAVAKLNRAQRDFLDEYSGVLTNMGENLSDGRQALGALAALADKTHFPRGKLNDLMQQKRTCGDDDYYKLLDELDSTTDPERRAELQREKQDWDAWRAERDQRYAHEAPTVQAVSDRFAALNDELNKQKDVLYDAKLSDGPHNLTSDGRIVDTNHVDPSAATYARGLRDLLASARGRVELALTRGR